MGGAPSLTRRARAIHVQDKLPTFDSFVKDVSESLGLMKQQEGPLRWVVHIDSQRAGSREGGRGMADVWWWWWRRRCAGRG